MEKDSVKTKKVSFRVVKTLHDEFSKKLIHLSLKRDSFLNQVLKNEITRMGQELQGTRLSDSFKRVTSSKLAANELVLVNVVLQEQVADQLNILVKHHNLVRDAFINRIIFFLLCKDGFMRRMEVPSYVEGDALNNYSNAIPVAPFDLLEITLSDPLFFIRQYLKSGLYNFNFLEDGDAYSCVEPPRYNNDVLDFL
ncbi:MAG: hypothetical protein IBX55_23720 [Methyloprofundus sp.]|nr:hypothetical protein [Methyloprofundus sp.]